MKASDVPPSPPSRVDILLRALLVLVTILIIVTAIERNEQWRNAFPIFIIDSYSWVWKNIFGENEWVAFVIGTNLWAAIMYWAAGIICLMLDFSDWKWPQRYKTQPGTNHPPSRNKFIKCVLQVLFNQLIMGPLLATALFPLLQWRGINFTGENIPGIATFLRHLVGFATFEEIGFYYSHRFFHEVKPLYAAIHKQHHEWTAPIGIAARYAHPVEDIFANVGPALLGPIVMGSPLVYWWIWLAMAMFITVFDHSGYHLPLLSSSEFHDFHHLRFETNYGAVGVLDALHNTDRIFRESVQIYRHHVLTGLKSAREEYPDNFLDFFTGKSD